MLTDFTATSSDVEMTISSGSSAGSNYVINEGATLTFKTTDPNVRIISIKPSVHSNYRGSVSFYDKATCSTGAIGTEMPRYNLQGVRMAAEQLAPGIYIRRQGNKATKIMVR